MENMKNHNMTIIIRASCSLAPYALNKVMCMTEQKSHTLQGELFFVENATSDHSLQPNPNFNEEEWSQCSKHLGKEQTVPVLVLFLRFEIIQGSAVRTWSRQRLDNLNEQKLLQSMLLNCLQFR